MLLGVGFEEGFFFRVRWAEPEEFDEAANLGVKILVFFFCAIGEPLAGVKDEVIVKESKGLELGDGGTSFWGEKAKVGEVEGLHKGVGDATPDDPVDAATASGWRVPVEVFVVKLECTSFSF